MKHFLVAFLLPMTLTAQNMQQLTEQLGKTVLYGDLALSPDGAHLAWVQSTAATTSKQTYVRETSANAPAKLVKLPITGERTDFDPAWSPDSKTLAFLSSAGERDQRQLWTVKSDASDAKKITKLNGYAARPRWSHDGKQIAFFYIEGAGGGGPLMAAPTTTGVIDTAIHNQRIAVLNVDTGQLREVSPRESSHLRFRLVARRQDVRRDGGARTRATTTGGLRRFTRSTSRRATPPPSTNLHFNSQFRVGRQMASRLRSLKD